MSFCLSAGGRGCGRSAYAGKPYPFVDVRLVGRGRGGGCAGPNVFPGYLAGIPRRPPAAFTDDGLAPDRRWSAEVDADGFYKIKGRLKDMYISGGGERLPGRGRGGAARAPAGSSTRAGGRASRTSAGGSAASRSSSPTVPIEDGAFEDELIEWCAERLAPLQGCRRRCASSGEIPRTLARQDPESGASPRRVVGWTSVGARRAARSSAAARARRYAAKKAAGCRPSRSSAISSITRPRS